MDSLEMGTKHSPEMPQASRGFSFSCQLASLRESYCSWPSGLLPARRFARGAQEGPYVSSGSPGADKLLSARLFPSISRIWPFFTASPADGMAIAILFRRGARKGLARSVKPGDFRSLSSAVRGG